MISMKYCGEKRVFLFESYRKHGFYGNLYIKNKNPNLSNFTAKKGGEHGLRFILYMN